MATATTPQSPAPHNLNALCEYQLPTNKESEKAAASPHAVK
jgi:hypothetical protein